MLCKPVFYRGMAYMNSLSLFTNFALYILAEVIIEDSSKLSYRLVYVWIIVIAKIALA